YINNPSEYQVSLIKELYDKDYIDLSVNGNFEELFEIIETEKKDVTIFDIQQNVMKYYQSRSNYSEKLNLFQPIINQTKIQRNDPCPCGSGKKHKKCCLN
ncbi:SEC-C metal-binding domain-containing protein, partial [Flavobacterium sp.]|uniref:YecA/YgfB family protein n=1 Tax=Flavobacterium sp. TaxID=239 RepID=UPI000EE76B55